METSPTHSYEWTANQGGFSSTSQNPTATPTTAGNYTYTVTVTNNVGCTASASVNVTVNACTDVEENANVKGEYNIYPNPTTGIININDELGINNNFEIIVCNSFGEIIMRGTNMNTIDISPYPNGIFYLSVKTNNQEIITRKIVLIK